MASSSANSATALAEPLAVASDYRQRHLPLNILVVDWFYYTKMGEYDFDPP
jgi:alpha-D-xyloside xylohydrolase